MRLPRHSRETFVACLTIGLASALNAVAQEDQGAWETWRVPGVRSIAGQPFAWCRAFVRVPDAWTQEQGLLSESVTLVLEHVLDACTVYVNGVEVGKCGSFPPDGRSARDEVNRFKIPPGTLRTGQFNAIVLKFYGEDGRVGLQGRPPVLAGYDEECVLSGDWQFRAGAEPPDSMAALADAPTVAAFSQLTRATSVLFRPRQLTPGRHLPPDAARDAMRVVDGLTVDLVLAEPDVAQPLSLDFDARGRLWVVEYRQYPFPAGLTMVSRDKFYRATYDQIPQPPPHHAPGADRISIHWDTNGDGRFDQHRIFADGLNIVSALEPGDGGVWVLNPPYLLFFADRDSDDVPDGDPDVHLEGFGLEDTHSVANSLTWGPDGWLYGAQGSTTSSRVTVRGSDRPAVYRDGAMIWRYHPRQRRYEIFAEGGGNAFGLEIDAQGRVYSGHNGGDTRGFYYVQGGYFQKGTDDKYGPLSNPNAYGYLMYLQHPPVARFSHDLVRYEGVGLPDIYQGKLLSIDPLHQQVITVDIEPHGAAFATYDREVTLASDDLGFRPVEITVGADGAIYVADFCEEFIAHGQHFQGQIDPSTGRVFRIRSEHAGDHVRLSDLDFASRPTLQLVDQLSSRDRWVRRTALRLIGQRQDRTVVGQLRRLLSETNDQPSLEALWALNLLDSLDDPTIRLALRHPSAAVRRWMVRLLGDDVLPGAFAWGDACARLAAGEHDAEVRAQLACTAKRLPTTAALPIVTALLTHDEDHDDPYIPLLIWWAVEAHAEDAQAILSMWRDSTLWQRSIAQQGLLSRIMRRYASGGRTQLEVAAQLLEMAPDPPSRSQLLEGFEQAFAGRSAADLPDRLAQALENAGGGSLSLRVRRGDAAAIEQALQVLQDRKADFELRRQYAPLLAETHQPAALDILLDVLRHEDRSALTSVALSVLPSFDDRRVPQVVLAQLLDWPIDTQQDACRLLASRASWAALLLTKIETEPAIAARVPVDAIVRMRQYNDEALQQRVGRWWPAAEDENLTDPAETDRVAAALRGGDADRYRGRDLFAQHCAKCHQLFRQGENIGPNLTPYQRDDTTRMALNIVNPSLEVREGFEMWLAETDDGRILSGFLFDQDSQVVVLRGADGQNMTIPRNQLSDLQRSRLSLMPAGLLKPLSDQQIRDLFAYLRSSQPLNEPPFE